MRVLEVADRELSALVRAAGAEMREPTVVLTTADGTADDAIAADAIASLPCIVVGAGHDPIAPPPHVDLVLEPGVAVVDDVIATVETNPFAAVTLALLLRAGPYRSLGAGLVAESSAYSMLQGGPEFAAWRKRTPRRRRRPEPGPAVRLARSGATLDVVLNRPHVRNALNREMRDGLLEAFALAMTDADIEAVEVRGEGPVFCSGGDLSEFA
ncbi:MAG: hypothetical protein QOI47_610, partial [Actinomycetota bacterium]|nr:hypothetical protein [Actinomycetota bacterium]